MAEIGTDLYLAYEAGYEAGKKDATQKGISVKATKEELFAAVRTIKEYCNSLERCADCHIRLWCWSNQSDQPFGWPDPEEGGGEDG